MKIFISYRRADLGGHAAALVGRIFDRLAKHYGAANVFMDVDTIPPGMRFDQYIGDAVDKADVLLAVVGPQWVELMQARTEGGADYVRVEIEAALERAMPVVPLLIGGAGIPQVRELPETLSSLVLHNAYLVDSGRDFNAHVSRLIADLDRNYAGKRKVVIKAPQAPEATKTAPPPERAKAPAKPKAESGTGPERRRKKEPRLLVPLIVAGLATIAVWFFVSRSPRQIVASDPIAVPQTPEAKPPVPATRLKPNQLPSDNGSPAARVTPVGIPAPPEPSAQEVSIIEIAPGAKIRFIYCPPGQFIMGDGGPEAHKVTLTRGFWLADTETTQAQWEAVMSENPSIFQGADNPVESVSWDDVQKFIAKIGNGYRLPTEAEWEYACRAGTTTTYSWGDEFGEGKANVENDDGPTDSKQVAFFKDHGFPTNSTMPVKRFDPNPWGIHDMHGNVEEWCEGWYDAYPAGSVTDPQGAASGTFRVYRGGSWDDAAVGARSAVRVRGIPSVRSNGVGFRLALAVPPFQATNPASRPSLAREVEIDPGVKVRFLYCAPWKFTMGEGTEAHEVTLTQGFWFAETETTQGQWQAVMKSNPSQITTLGPEAPVETVSWDDIAGPEGFITRIQPKAPAGLQFTLPTEAQWEYACRAGTTTTYSWGDEFVEGKANVGNYSGTNVGAKKRSASFQAKGLPTDSTMPVKQFDPNPWGFYDLHGNVREWCQDWYGDFPVGPTTDPRGAASGFERVYRGGAWSYSGDYARSADRFRLNPSLRGSNLGFRLALAVPPSVQRKAAGPQKPSD
jgi:formylglycine-generating enzyme